MSFIAQKITNWIASWRPFPICVLGFDIRRWENQIYDFWFNAFTKKLLFMKSMPDKGPTHLQYGSPFGFLLQWPLCFHVWYQFKPQQKDAKGNHIPGSEKVFYWRIGVVRWSAEGYVSGWDINLFGHKFNTVFGTWNGPSLHWD